MASKEEYSEYLRIMRILESGQPVDLDALSHQVEGFPNGCDGFIQRRWITNAIDCGSKLAVTWMIQQGVDLSFCDDEGYTVLHSAIDRKREDKYDILNDLLAAGAPVNTRGTNNWTPAHMAAAREDIQALKILIKHGADLTARTTIDYHATPLEEAKYLGRLKSVEFLKSIRGGH